MYEKKSPAVFSLSGLSFLYEPRYPEAMPGPHYDSFVIITFIYWYGISIPSLSNVSLIASVMDHFAVSNPHRSCQPLALKTTLLSPSASTTT